jgi:hypothetical protein
VKPPAESKSVLSRDGVSTIVCADGSGLGLIERTARRLPAIMCGAMRVAINNETATRGFIVFA